MWWMGCAWTALKLCSFLGTNEWFAHTRERAGDDMRLSTSSLLHGVGEFGPQLLSVEQLGTAKYPATVERDPILTAPFELEPQHAEVERAGVPRPLGEPTAQESAYPDFYGEIRRGRGLLRANGRACLRTHHAHRQLRFRRCRASLDQGRVSGVVRKMGRRRDVRQHLPIGVEHGTSGRLPFRRVRYAEGKTMSLQRWREDFRWSVPRTAGV